MATTVNIEHIYDKGTADEWQSCVRVCTFPKHADLDLVDADEMVTDLEKLDIEFNYPLDTPAIISFERPGGFTRFNLFEAIYTGYKYIYDLENGAAGDPGMVPGMLNRARSHGPFGIWGHVIEDLFIESVEIHNNGKVSLGMGS